MSVLELLLLIAAYLRKANHPTESDAQIQRGIMEDISKIRAALSAVDRSALDEGQAPE